MIASTSQVQREPPFGLSVHLKPRHSSQQIFHLLIFPTSLYGSFLAMSTIRFKPFLLIIFVNKSVTTIFINDHFSTTDFWKSWNINLCQNNWVHDNAES